MRKITSLLMLFCMFVGTAWAQDELKVGQPYLIKAANADTDLYLRSNTKSSNLILSAEPVHYFYLETSTEADHYDIKTVCEGDVVYVQASGWDGKVNAKEKTPFTINSVAETDGVYTISQTSTDCKGDLGVDALSENEKVYCNKNGEKAQWQLIPVDPILVSELDASKQYRIRSAFSGKYMECVDFAKKEGEGAYQFKEISPSAGQKFSFESAEEGKFYLKQTDGTTTYYVNHSSWNFIAGAEKTTPFTIEEIAIGVYALNQQAGNYTGYAGNENDGNVNTKIYNNQPGKQAAAIWIFEEVTDEILKVTYIYKYNDTEIAREEIDAIKGNPFPTPSVPFGYVGEKPDGDVENAGEYEIELTLNLPFKFSEDVAGIANWYFIKMHPDYPSFICEEGGILPYSNGKTVASDDTRDTYAWAFVGNPVDGFKVVNKATGNAIVSTGEGDVTTGTFAEGTTLTVCASSVRTAFGFFTLRPTDGDYLNANGTNGRVQHWEEPDGGSTIQLFDYTPQEDVTKDWTYADYETIWGTALDAKEYPSVAINTGANGNAVHYTSIDIKATGPRSIETLFKFSSGNCALQLLGVDVINENGDVIAADYHVGSTGHNSSNNTYTTKLPEVGSYTMRCFVWTNDKERLNDTNGRITVSFREAKTSEFSHDVTFSAEYATLNLGYKVAVPTGVEAYVVSLVENSVAKLAKVDGAIPAATPVILKKVGEDANYKFNYTEEPGATIEENLLKGSIVDKYIYSDSYVLAKKDDLLAFYLADKNQQDKAAFLNNANKAYLPASAVTAAGARFITFDFGTETAIDELKGENGNVKTVIYDLAGRRVQGAQKGIFIVSGVKVIK